MQSRNTTGLSKAITANMADVHRFVFTVETTCGERWHASNLLFKAWQKVSDHSQRRDVGRRSLLAEPTVEIDPFTIPMEVIPNDFDSSPISQTKATEVPVATFRGPRRSSKLQARPHDRERGGAHRFLSDIVGVIDSGRTPPSPFPLATNAWRNVVRDEHPHRSRPRGGDCSSRADSSRSMEYDKKRPQTACL